MGGRIGEVYAFRKCNLSPLISRLRDSFPPRGSLFKIPFGFTQQEKMQEFGKRFISVVLLLILLLPEILFAMFAQRKEGFPLGGSCRVSD